MKKGKGILVRFFIVIVLVSVSVTFYYRNIVNHPFKAKEKEIEFDVKNGDSLYKVLNSLKSNNEIKNLYIAKLYIKRNGLETTIKPGRYQLSSDINLSELVNALNKGIFNKNLVKVTIPEGYDIDKIAIILQKNGIISKEEFLQSCRQYPKPKIYKKYS